MQKRLTQPANNKYYIRTVTGGLNGAVAGKPTIKGANVLCNCVGYANGRFNEIINDPDLKGVVLNFKYQLACNAENFIEKAKSQGLKISATPIEGGIMVWQKGKSLSGSDGAGHVAIVEAVYDDGTILTSESGYNSWAFKTVRRSNSNGRWGQGSAYKFRGCIINPGVKDPKVVPVPPLTIDGVGGACTVRAMQRFLGTPQDGVISGQSKGQKKYYPALEAIEFGKGGSACIKALQRWLGVPQDGILGPATIKAWQKKLGVAVDGVFGSASMKAWQKYLNEHDKAVFPAPSPAPAPSVTTPSITSGAAKLVAEARSLAWAKGTPKSKYAWKGGSATKAFKAALNKVYPNRSKWSAAPKAGCSCDVFVGTVVRSSGLDSKFPRGFDEQFKYKSNNFDRLVYSNVTPWSVSKDGDIVLYTKNKSGTSKHVLIRGDGVIYEAQYENTYGHVNTGVKKKLNVKRPKVVILRAK